MQKISKFVCWVALCLSVCSVALVAAPGNQQPGAPPEDLPPSPFEAFAARSTAKVVWSKTIGRLESDEARATVTAVAVEDSTQTPSMMRGVRIDLEHLVPNPKCNQKYLAWRVMCKRANAAVYVEEGRLEAVRNGVMSGAAELRHFEFISQYKTNASGQASKGLIVCGYQFSGLRPGELAELFTRGIAELKAASR